MYQRTEHECCDAECVRKWTPSPTQCMSDDNHCPSCVLHHRKISERRVKTRRNEPFVNLTWKPNRHDSNGELAERRSRNERVVREIQQIKRDGSERRTVTIVV